MRSHLFIVSFSICATRILFRKYFLEMMISRLFPTYYSMRLMACCLLLSSLSHLELCFVQSDKCGSDYVLLQGVIPFDQSHLFIVCILQCMFLSYWFIIMFTWMCGLCCSLHLIPLTTIPVFIAIPCGYLITTTW